MYDRYSRRIHTLRVSVTDRCNLRCVYCMPAEGVRLLPHRDILSFEEISELVQVGARMGLSRVRLTGGEPLVRSGILTLVRMVADSPGIEDLSMTTNGTLLSQHAGPLRQAGIRRLNISLDTVDPEAYRRLTRGGDILHVLAGIEAARAAGFDPIKLNCVITESADEPDAQAVARYAGERGLSVQFIRRMDTTQGRFWPVTGGHGGDCPRCDRLRVSSDGFVYPCLFSDLRFSIRELGPETALRNAIDQKPASGQKSHNELHVIGG